jgi:uncharacterized protein (UPF0333 family)
MKNEAIASLLVVVILASAGAGYFIGTTSQRAQTSTATESTQTITVYTLGSSPTTTNLVSVTTVGSETFVTWNATLRPTGNNAGATFVYPISVNYTGPWSLHYWVENYTGTRNSISGNLIGSGNSEIWITFSAYAQYTLCASATKLPNDSAYSSTLTLSVLGQNGDTTASDPTVEVCGTMAP